MNITTTITVKTSYATKYALVNYIEIIKYYQQPFYKKWFTNPPVKILININK
jgi:hypothetical protein